MSLHLHHNPCLIKSPGISVPLAAHPAGPLALSGPSGGSPLHKEEADTDVLTEYDSPYSLIVWNDEVNTFEWVIETLMEVCGQSLEQAEQCAMIIHTKGKYAVKRGSYDELKPFCDAITDRGIGATIEIMSGT